MNHWNKCTLQTSVSQGRRRQRGGIAARRRRNSIVSGASGGRAATVGSRPHASEGHCVSASSLAFLPDRRADLGAYSDHHGSADFYRRSLSACRTGEVCLPDAHNTIIEQRCRIGEILRALGLSSDEPPAALPFYAIRGDSRQCGARATMGRSACRYQRHRALDTFSFRIMVLRDPDELPSGDVGLERAIANVYGRAHRAASLGTRVGAHSDPSPAGICGGLSGTSNSGEAICQNAFISRQGRIAARKL